MKKFSHPTDILLREVKDARVRAAFAKVDRAYFIPNSIRDQAWSDRPLPIAEEATISQPSLVAKMTEWLQVQPHHGVLEIGTGSGYQTAILAELARAIATVEYSAELSQSAQARLERLGYHHIYFRAGDGADGWSAHAPYDRIMATVAFPQIPNNLLAQLSPNGGVAIVPVGPRNSNQDLIRYTKNGELIEQQTLCLVRFLSLR